MMDNSDIKLALDGSFKLFLTLQGWGCPTVAAYEDEVRRKSLSNPDEIIIKDEKINIEFTYPLSVRVEFEYVKKGGFSRMDLWRCIYEGYKKIYEEEEAEVGDPGSYENLYNRKKSNGNYGIWGHYIEELYLESIRYDAKKKLITMFIGS